MLITVLNGVSLLMLFRGIKRNWKVGGWGWQFKKVIKFSWYTFNFKRLELWEGKTTFTVLKEVGVHLVFGSCRFYWKRAYGIHTPSASVYKSEKSVESGVVPRGGKFYRYPRQSSPGKFVFYRAIRLTNFGRSFLSKYRVSTVEGVSWISFGLGGPLDRQLIY